MCLSFLEKKNESDFFLVQLILQSFELIAHQLNTQKENCIL